MKIELGAKNKILRKKSEPIKEITPDLKDLFPLMVKKMVESKGIGLAAPQIGKNIQLFVIDESAFDKKFSDWRFEKHIPQKILNGFIFINPEIRTFSPQKQNDIEGCLSLPGKRFNVKRSKKLVLIAQDQDGKKFKLHAKGLLARVIQHEYDHLQGILICDKSKV
jgi:peptide deformylase